MNWETFVSKANSGEYLIDIEQQQALILMKKKNRLIAMMPRSVRLTYISYLFIIYAIRTFSLIALPVSIYYKVEDWWFGLFGWLLSDYLYYELGRLSAQEIIRFAQKEENYYDAIKNFEGVHRNTFLLIHKKSELKPTPFYKKMIKIFLH